MQEIFCYFDDSGVLHPNEESGMFVYAGFVFPSRFEKDNAKRMYTAANKKICLATNRTDEIKAHGLETKYKRSLYNSVRNFPSISTEVTITALKEDTTKSKYAICRYKDYLIKLAIKRKVKDFIDLGLINPREPIRMYINVDEQLTASNGKYDLEEAVRRELCYGTSNWRVGKEFPPILHGGLNTILKYCESSQKYLIQASDILANRIWSSYRIPNPKMREIPNHVSLTFPGRMGIL